MPASRSLYSADRTMKRCAECREYLPISEFAIRKAGGHYSYCWNCNARLSSARYYADHERLKARQREYHKRTGGAKSRRQNLSLYKMTPNEFEAMLTAQNGVCAVCFRPEMAKRRKNLAVDHNHHTGKVRGLLCDRCNLSLGLLRDDRTVLESAINYLAMRDDDFDIVKMAKVLSA